MHLSDLLEGEYLGHLIARGSNDGMGNPNFVSQTRRLPKFATKRQEGERVTLSLELEIPADVRLVGMQRRKEYAFESSYR